jgi:hypothetical protein
MHCLRKLCAAVLVAWLCICLPAIATEERKSAIQLKPGPHLFLDDFLIASISNVVRRPITLVREALSESPVVTAAAHDTFQPYFTVVRESQSGTFRLWYGAHTVDFNTSRSRLAYMESPDGIHWTNPPRFLDVDPIQFGASVIDEGAEFPNPQQRYKFGWYMNGGLKLATSPDGIHWQPLTKNVVIQHNHDINGIYFDALRQRYTAMLSFYLPGETWTGQRRITRQSVSTNLLNWTEPTPVLTPDRNDEGEIQFYAMDGFLRRGDLLIGLVKVLRDDLKADNPPEPPEAYGIGYTTLAWTRDGSRWTRERTPFLDRDPRKGAWDHAHAWIDEQVLVGDEVYLYYAGYKSGHKVNRFQERQIGLVRMKRDRYVAYESAGEGRLRTRPLLLSSRRLFINADASRGEVRVQLLTPEGKLLSDSKPGRKDSVKAAVEWQRAINLEKPVVLEFQLRNAALFGFEAE